MRHIPTSVELNFLEGLAKRITQNSNQHEEMMSGIQKEISNLLIETQNAYPEYYVQESCREIQYLLEELNRYNVQLDDDMKKKARNLYETVGIYKTSEYEIKKKIDFEKWIRNNNDLAINRVNQISPNWALNPVSNITNTNVDIYAKPININPENEIKELQAEKKWLRESSNSQGGNTADFKKLDYDSTAINMANFRKLDELLLEIDPVEAKDPYEGTQYYYPEDYANIAIINKFFKKLEITSEEILYIDDMSIEEKKQLAILLGYDWTLYEGREEDIGTELATLMASYCSTNGLEDPYYNWGEKPCIYAANLAFLRESILQDIENKEEKRLEVEHLQEEMTKDFILYMGKAKAGDYLREYERLQNDPNYTQQVELYGHVVYEEFGKDKDAGMEGLINRYVNNAPEQIQMAGFYAILPLLGKDFSEIEIEEYVTLMGPIWELNEKYLTYKDVLSAIGDSISLLSVLLIPLSFEIGAGLKGAAILATMDNAGDVVSLAITLATGDRAGTVINIGSLAAPQILELLKPIRNINIKYIDNLPDKQVVDIIETGEAISEAVIKSNKEAISKMTSFDDEVVELAGIQGLTLKEFTNMRLTTAEYLELDEVQRLVKIRESIPMPTSDTLLSKAISKDARANIMANGQHSDTIGGYIARAQDMKGANTYDDYYNQLRLDFYNTPHNPDTDKFMSVVRFKTDDARDLKVPYGGVSNADIETMSLATGIDKTELVKQNWPFSGNGYTVSTTNQTIPEFVAKPNQFMGIEDGAVMYDIYKDGTEIPVAEFINGEWKKLIRRL